MIVHPSGTSQLRKASVMFYFCNLFPVLLSKEKLVSKISFKLNKTKVSANNTRSDWMCLRQDQRVKLKAGTTDEW